MTIRRAIGHWFAWVCGAALLVSACTQTAPQVTTSTELPPEVANLPASFYQGTGLEPGGEFDLAKVRTVTADPLQAAVIEDLEDQSRRKTPQQYIRYTDVQVLGGSCSGQGGTRVCELRVQRAYDASDPEGKTTGARNDTRVFRAKQDGGTWKLFDTQIDGRWLTDLAAGGNQPPAGG